MTAILNEIVENKKQELVYRKQQQPLDLLRQKVFPLPKPFFEDVLRSPSKQHLILEVKPASPSAGVLKANLNIDELLSVYQQYASCISVLTDERYFGGSLDRLAYISQHVPQPTLCKDFILEPYQVQEARAAYAAAVLLIVKILTDDALHQLSQEILRLGMTPVIEIQNESELARALQINPSVILINNRNLATFEIDLETTVTLAPLIPKETVIISASGIETRQDIERLLPAANCFLIGSALMKLPFVALPRKLQELAGI